MTKKNQKKKPKNKKKKTTIWSHLTESNLLLCSHKRQLFSKSGNSSSFYFTFKLFMIDHDGKYFSRLVYIEMKLKKKKK